MFSIAGCNAHLNLAKKVLYCDIGRFFIIFENGPCDYFFLYVVKNLMPSKKCKQSDDIFTYNTSMDNFESCFCWSNGFAGKGSSE